MKLLILALVVGLTASATLPKPSQLHEDHEIENARELYEQFKRQYKKNFENEVDEKRFKIFKDNLGRAKQYQALEQGTAKYGVTRFSDLTPEEFTAKYANANLKPGTASPNLKYNVKNMPKSIDWREKGAVTPVEDQGNCGSCWAFSAIGNVEGQWFLKTGQLIPMSKQQLVDCDKLDQGCSGGLPLQAYGELMSMGGVQSQESYPYVGREETCKLNQTKFVAYVNASIELSECEREQAAWLAEHGPLSVGLNAKPLQFYQSGIIFQLPFMCPASGLNHGVLTVGYGGSFLNPYWIVKNSWSEDWGEKGYFRIHRGSGTCGINKLVTSAIIR